MTALRLAWRLLRRDLAAGEVRVLLAALVLAVSAVSSVAFLTDRAGRALAQEANRLLGGDAVLRGDEPLGDAPLARAREMGLRTAQTMSFRSMVRGAKTPQLSEVRALGDGYPLRGQFRIDDGRGAARNVAGGPAAGTIWLARESGQRLGATVGDTVQLGDSRFTVAGLVVQEPDAAADFFNVAPRVFIAMGDLAATGLMQEGSRATYRLAVAGDAAAVARFNEATRAGLGRGQRLETVSDARPEVRTALDRADRFLGLTALLAVMLSAVAIAMAARRHARRHVETSAMLRCLGASQRTIVAVHVIELLLIGVAGALVGLALAWALQAALGAWLAQAMRIAIPAASAAPALQGFAVGMAVLFAFALPPVLALRGVPALRVLRRELAVGEPAAWVVGATGLGAVLALLWWKSGSATMGTIVLLGIGGTLAALGALAAAMILVVRALRGRLRGPWRYGLANVTRRAGATVAQTAALGLGLMAILLLTLVRTDLLSQWQRALPTDAPNRFIINVQTDQTEPVRALMKQHGAASPEIFPMIRGRLVEKNGEAVDTAALGDTGDRARRLAEREFNLSFADSFRAQDNTLDAGRYWDPAAPPASPELSVDAAFAKALGWQLGDRIAFDIAGRPFEATITSLRLVSWDSFRPNFFVVASPGSLDGYATSWITAMHVPRGDNALTIALVDAFPNVSVIDVDAVLDQVRATTDQVAAAVAYVFWFTLAAGIIVLIAALGAANDERMREAAVMRVLGASRRQLRLAHATEFSALGLVAGLTAALAASIVSGLIATRVFDLPWAPDWRLAAAGALAGVVVVLITGLLATRRVVTTPPSITLRELRD